jgi:hypothetical protein
VDLRTLLDATELIQLLAPKTAQIKAIQFSHDGARLLMRTGAGGLREWDLTELRRQLATIGLDCQLGQDRGKSETYSRRLLRSN